MNKIKKTHTLSLVAFISCLFIGNSSHAQFTDDDLYGTNSSDSVRMPAVDTLFTADPIINLYKEDQSKNESRETEVYFTYPLNSDAIQTRILELIDNAKEEILINAYAITDAEIATALLKAKALKGVTVVCILEPRPAIRNYKAPAFFIDNSILTFYSQDIGFNNNTYMIVDKTKLITGSYQFTQSSAQKNAENLLIFNNNEELVSSYYLNFLAHLSVCEIPELQLLKTPDIRDEILSILKLR